ncbi:tripartite tricarboxylate transporter substrate binding protein [Massilia niastensis]|uniref:tripartite tricarboxylate transporter substrate binding protein n=1 Tax=Massilia niastensis TaxID=544911 RepID=UPI000380B81A|nr:tripartite tricarboxylate transporter substrate binding protein [Massilia niastensis]
MKQWIIGLVGSLCISQLAHADAPYPDRPITLVVGFAAGGSTDVVARIIAQRASEILGKPIIVENKTGAGGIIATDFVAKSRPDGYTLLFGTSAYAITATLSKKLPYDPAKALEPVSMVAEVPIVLAVNPAVKAASARELVSLIKANPGKLHYGSAGNGSALHMAVELLAYQEKLSAVHVPYRGAAPALQAVMAGDVEFVADAVSTIASAARTGKVKALAVTGPRRSSVLPDLPTMQEAGLPNYQTALWNMVMVPSGTPPALVTKLQAVLQQALQTPATRERLAKLGVEPADNTTPAHAKAFLQQEVLRWKEVIQAGHIEPD